MNNVTNNKEFQALDARTREIHDKLEWEYVYMEDAHRYIENLNQQDEEMHRRQEEAAREEERQFLEANQARIDGLQGKVDELATLEGEVAEAKARFDSYSNSVVADRPADWTQDLMEQYEEAFYDLQREAMELGRTV